MRPPLLPVLMENMLITLTEKNPNYDSVTRPLTTSIGWAAIAVHFPFKIASHQLLGRQSKHCVNDASRVKCEEPRSLWKGKK